MTHLWLPRRTLEERRRDEGTEQPLPAQMFLGSGPLPVDCLGGRHRPLSSLSPARVVVVPWVNASSVCEAMSHESSFRHTTLFATHETQQVYYILSFFLLMKMETEAREMKWCVSSYITTKRLRRIWAQVFCCQMWCPLHATLPVCCVLLLPVSESSYSKRNLSPPRTSVLRSWVSFHTGPF